MNYYALLAALFFYACGDGTAPKLISQPDSGIVSNVYDRITSNKNVDIQRLNTTLKTVLSSLTIKPALESVREHYLKNSIVQTSSDGAWFNAINNEMQGAYPLPQDLRHEVKEVADFLLEQEKAGKLTLGAGRKSLILAMERDPVSLEKDLPRIAHAMSFGVHPIQGILLSMTARENYDTVLGQLVDYINKNKPNHLFTVEASQLGKFFVAEIFYATTQGLAAEVTKLLYDDLIVSTDWALERGGQKKVNFSFSAGHLLSITLSFEGKMMNTSTMRAKTLKTESTAVFTLDTGEISYSHSYELQGSAKKSAKRINF